MTLDEFKKVLDEFRGDIDVYNDGTVQLRPADYREPVIFGHTFSAAVEKVLKKKQK